MKIIFHIRFKEKTRKRNVNFAKHLHMLSIGFKKKTKFSLVSVLTSLYTYDKTKQTFSIPTVTRG